MLDEIRQRIRGGDHSGAEERGRAALGEAESRYGADSLEVARILDLIVEAMWRAGRSGAEDAQDLVDRSLRIKRLRPAESGPGLAISLRNQAILHEDTGEPDLAEPVYREIIGIREAACGPSHPLVAHAHTDLGNFLLVRGRYGEARPHYERTLQVQEKIFGRRHVESARTLNNLALLSHETGDFEASETLYHECIEIREALLGEDSLDVAWSLNGLAQLQSEMGDYRRAEDSTRRALEIRETILGPDHVQVAGLYNNLGNLYRETGRYEEARASYERALEIVTKQLGPDHLDAARTRHNLAWLSYLMGDYTRGEELYEQALRVRREILGSDHLTVATTLDNFAVLLSAKGADRQAMARQKESLEITERVVGRRHRQYAWSLMGLADLHMSRGETGTARGLLTEALGITREIMGEEHPWVARGLSSLGDALMEEGRPGQAREKYALALDIREKSLGPRHPMVGTALARLGRALAVLGEDQQALETALRAEAIGRENLLLALRSLPERQALRYAEVRSSGLDVALSMLGAGTVAPSAPRIWREVVRSRALILDEMASRHRLVHATGDPQVERLLRSFRESSERLAYLTVRGPEAGDPERYRTALALAARKREAAERALARRGTVFRRGEEEARPELEEILQALPARTALVAFVQYREQPVAAEAATPSPARPPGNPALPGGTGDGDAYMAFVAGPGLARPRAVPVGSHDEIGGLVSAWTRQILQGASERRAASREAEGSYREAARALRRRIWDPVAGVLGQIDTVLVVPDGALRLVNLAVLAGDDGRYLLESGPTIHQISAERDIVEMSRSKVMGRGLLAMGGPSFGGSGSAGESPAGTRGACASYQDLWFRDLPGAALETREIAELWKEAVGEREPLTRLSLGEATEVAFRVEAPGKRIAHVASHGFFLEDSCSPAGEGSRAIGKTVAGSALLAVPPAGVSPLLLAGVALAGANERAAAQSGEEDGILTAEEIVSMNLEGLEWVVLSACDTARGEIVPGEGVLGLQRALRVAGVRTVILSLWQVEDSAAREWMKALYTYRLGEGMETASAVREAALRVLQRRRAEGRATHPFYWGAFVASGDWR